MVESVFLPLSLAFMMYSLGLGLTFADFGRVISRPKAFGVGAVNQLILLPLAAFILLLIFDLPPALAVGFFMLALAPGGSTSNFLTRIANGDVALSVTLTAVVSLVVLFTVPLGVNWAVGYYQGAEVGQAISVSSIAIPVFVLATVPVVLGVLTRRFADGFAQRSEPGAVAISTALLIFLTAYVFWRDWAVVQAHFAQIGLLLILLNGVMMTIGWLSARMSGFDAPVATSVTLETGVQNTLLTFTLGGILGTILGGASTETGGYALYALPAILYTLVMYASGFAVVLWRRAVTR